MSDQPQPENDQPTNGERAELVNRVAEVIYAHTDETCNERDCGDGFGYHDTDSREDRRRGCAHIAERIVSLILPAGSPCDCDYWHGKHRFHCAINFPPATTDGGQDKNADIRLTNVEREWIALTIHDAVAEPDTDRAARLIEARVETLIRGRISPVLALADAWDREAASLGRSLSELMLRDGARQVRKVVSPPGATTPTDAEEGTCS